MNESDFIGKLSNKTLKQILLLQKLLIDPFICPAFMYVIERNGMFKYLKLNLIIFTKNFKL